MADEELAVQEEATGEAEELSDDEKAMARLKEAVVVKREDLGGLRAKMTVTVPRDILDERVNEQLTELKRESTLPGFRKGHAPIKLVEKRFAADVGEELKGKLVGSGYLAAVEKEGLKPLGDPFVWVKVKEERLGEDQKPRTVEVEKLVSFDKALDHMSLPKQGELTFTCELELKPEFELPSLEKVPVEKPTITIDDEDVDTELRKMRMFRGTFEPVEDGEIERDDLLYASMKMIVDGETIATEDNFDLAARDIRIKGVPLIGLGDALEGRNVGDEVTFEATVPEDHDNADLRGKTAKFEFKISEIKRLALPEIDEAFLESMGAESEEELRSTMKESLEREVDQIINRRMKEQVGDYLVEKTNIEIPAGLSHRQTERSLARRMIEMYQSGYPQAEIEKQMDELRMSAHDQTVRDLKLYFILDKLGEEQEVEVNEEEINGAIAGIAQRTGKRFDRVRDELAKGDGLMTLYLRLRDDKILESLLAQAEVKEVEGPKKKGSAKRTRKSEETREPESEETKKSDDPKAKSSSKTKAKTKSKKKEE